MFRFTNNGWGSATCWTMNEVYKLLPQQDVHRVERIEMLDEKVPIEFTNPLPVNGRGFEQHH